MQITFHSFRLVKTNIIDPLFSIILTLVHTYQLLNRLSIRLNFLYNSMLFSVVLLAGIVRVTDEA